MGRDAGHFWELAFKTFDLVSLYHNRFIGIDQKTRCPAKQGFSTHAH
jgi:hypothetical protein